MTAGIEREGLFPSTCPQVVEGSSITVAWRSVGFIHWSYEPDALARLLPSSVSVDLYGGRAWAGYQFVTVTPTLRGGRAALDGRRSLLPLSRFGHAEARAVIAVVDASGRPGLWYASVDTNRRLIALGMRRWLGLPAYEAESRFSAVDDHRDYWTQRPDGTRSRLKLTVGPPIEATDIERFLTARWRVLLPSRRWELPATHREICTVHEPWALHRASVESFDDDTLIAAGLPPALGPGQALWSPGLSVEIGRPSNDR